jgi:hypothetical protein
MERALSAKLVARYSFDTPNIGKRVSYCNRHAKVASLTARLSY